MNTRNPEPPAHSDRRDPTTMARVNIGPIQLASPFCQAGLAGYSDRAMRVVARRRGCAYAVTEALLDTIMLSGGRGLAKSIDVNDEDHPVAGQIIGSEPAEMAAAATILRDRGYDVIDLNFACPVKKIRTRSRGGHMLRDTDRAVAMLQSVRDALGATATLSVSTRRGFDDSTESVDAFGRIVETAFELGYAAIRVHARTVEQKYLGRAAWAFLADLKRRYPDKTILGSGDVFTAEDAVRMLLQTRVDIVWIARGAIGNPWIFRQAADLLAGKPVVPPTIAEQREALSEHFAVSLEIHGEQVAGRRMRKMGIKYARFHPEADAVKKQFINVQSLRSWNAVLDGWYTVDAPGIWPRIDAADEVNDPGMQGCPSG